MANVGLPYHGFCPFERIEQEDGTFTEILGTGKLTRSIISYQAEPTSEQEPLWAGDRQEEIQNGAVTGNNTIERSHLSLEDEAVLTDADYDKETRHLRGKGTPNPPYVRTGALSKETHNNKPYYISTVYLSVKFSTPADQFETKTKTPAYRTKTLTGTLSENADGYVVDKREFDNYEDALVYFKAMLNIPESVQKPEATPAAGEIAAGGKVTLTSEEGSEIRYTVDGKNVDKTAPLYSAPVTISETTTLKARAYNKTGDKPSSTQFVGIYTVK